MNVKVYYSAYRSADGAALYYGGGPDVGQFIRRGRIESYYTRADGSAAITMECFGVSPNGLKVELWSSCEDKPEDAVKNRAAAVDAYDGEGDEFGAARRPRRARPMTIAALSAPLRPCQRNSLTRAAPRPTPTNSSRSRGGARNLPRRR
ncbi:MAG: hypothetical protein ACLU0O_12070 [Collinsella sp.]